MSKLKYFLAGVAVGLMLGLFEVIEMNIEVNKLIGENQALVHELHVRGFKVSIEQKESLQWRK